MAGSAGLGGTAGAAGTAAQAGSAGQAGAGGQAGTAGQAGAAGQAGSAGASGATNGLGDFQYRRRITITANEPLPAGYSLRFTVDHAQLVAQGQSLASGRDVRIARWTGATWSERDRVLGLESAWDLADSVVWFRTPGGIPAGTDQSYYLYYGDDNASPPPRNPDAVFALFEGFESGDASGWTTPNAAKWAVSTSQARSGTYALMAVPSDHDEQFIVAQGVDQADVAVDAFWRLSTITDMDVAQGVRMRLDPTVDLYETNLEGTDGWTIAKVIGGGWTQLIPNPSGQNPQAETWTRITVLMFGTEMAVQRNGTVLVPTTDVGSELASGSVGFRVWEIPQGERWWIDDIRVRELVRPAPVVEVGPEEQAPFSTP